MRPRTRSTSAFWARAATAPIRRRHRRHRYGRAVIESLQSLVSRNISPLNQAVLTLGTIHGGTAGNIIAGQVDMTGTLRTTDPATRQFCWDAITRITEHTCLAYGGRGEAEITPGYAALINTPEMVDLLLETASAVVGPAHLHPKEAPSLGGEDFSFFLEKAPGVFWHLGCACREKGITAPLHSAQFDIDESCLKLACASRPCWPCGFCPGCPARRNRLLPFFT